MGPHQPLSRCDHQPRRPTPIFVPLRQSRRREKLTLILARLPLSPQAARPPFSELLVEASPFAEMNRKMAQMLHERQVQLVQQQQQQQPRMEQHSPRREGHRPTTAGASTRPKVTCAMLNETERMLLKAPNRHKSMLSAGLIFPTEQTTPPRSAVGSRPRPCSATPHGIHSIASSPAAAVRAANSRAAAHAVRSPTRQAAWGAGAVPAPPTLSPRAQSGGAGGSGMEYGDNYGSKPVRPSTAHPAGSHGTHGSGSHGHAVELEPSGGANGAGSSGGGVPSALRQVAATNKARLYGEVAPASGGYPGHHAERPGTGARERPGTGGRERPGSGYVPSGQRPGSGQPGRRHSTNDEYTSRGAPYGHHHTHANGAVGGVGMGYPGYPHATGAPYQQNHNMGGAGAAGHPYHGGGHHHTQQRAASAGMQRGDRPSSAAPLTGNGAAGARRRTARTAPAAATAAMPSWGMPPPVGARPGAGMPRPSTVVERSRSGSSTGCEAGSA